MYNSLRVDLNSVIIYVFLILFKTMSIIINYMEITFHYMKNNLIKTYSHTPNLF